VRIISRKRLREFWETHPDARAPLEHWFRVTRHAAWSNLAEVRRTFNSADVYEGKVIFDIGGNRYRIIAVIRYHRQKLYVRHVLTHREYSRGNWKDD
jgi:mRNA interferase HigB